MLLGYVVTESESGRKRIAVGQSIVIGRGDDCEIVLNDRSASRQHMQIRVGKDGFVWRDLGSTNGTQINDVLLRSGTLHHDDRITIGDSKLIFEIEQTCDGKTIPVHDSNLFRQAVIDSQGLEQPAFGPPRERVLLEAVYKVMNALASTFEPCSLVDRILKTTMEAVRAQRGAVLFAGPDGELLPCRYCGRVHSIRDGKVTSAALKDLLISGTVVRRVLTNREGILAQSVADDPVFDHAVSATALNLTSVVCVPIRTRERVLGVLYLDTDLPNRSYNQDDLLLAAAVGNSAGLALENAGVHQSLLEKERTEQEIAAAWAIQEGFLAKQWPKDDPRFEVYGETRPAKVVGGDFFDFVHFSDDTVGVLIGDVSGKGVPAALTMAQLLAEFRVYVHSTSSPAEILARLNQGFVARSRHGTFCTMLFATLNLSNGNLQAACAGHHPALLMAADSITTLFEPSGPPVGVVSEASWTNTAAAMRPGQSLLLFTDGIVEARAGEAAVTDYGSPLGSPVEYQLETLKEFTQKYHDSSPRQMIGAVNREVKRFCSPFSPHDDCTMIALRYLGQSR